jgi:hypothetical protein
VLEEVQGPECRELQQWRRADVKARADCVAYYGTDKWFAGHRNGATGLSNPNTEDINSTLSSAMEIQKQESVWRKRKTDDTSLDYKTAVYWIQQQIDSNWAHKSDDIRFWVDVVAI